MSMLSNKELKDYKNNGYVAPIEDIKFIINELVGISQDDLRPEFEELGSEDVNMILIEAAKFSSEILAPINSSEVP